MEFTGVTVYTRSVVLVIVVVVVGSLAVGPVSVAACVVTVVVSTGGCDVIDVNTVRPTDGSSR